MMEDLCGRFPLLSKMVFENLDNQSLVKFKESSWEINNHLQNERFYWIRIIKKHVEHFKEFADAWKKVIDKTPVKTVRELAITVESYFNFSLQNADDLFQNYQTQLHPLHVAAERGHLNLCKYIVEKTGDFNPKLADGFTALHFAAEQGHFEVYKFIWYNVEGKNPADDGGETPYDCAVENDRWDLARFIIENLDDKNPKNHLSDYGSTKAALKFKFKSLGSTPLHMAAKYGYYDMCQLIIDKIEDKNPVDDEGWTPLHYAAKRGHMDICKMIASYLDDKNPRTNSGITPKDLINEYVKGVLEKADDLFQ